MKANLDNVTEAAASAREVPADFRVSITNAPGSGAYPIASYTWFLVPQDFDDRARGKDLAAFLMWMINDGQAMTKALGYAPLPRSIAARISRTIAQIPPR
jgi:phosphate transport system substrate-binding protein